MVYECFDRNASDASKVRIETSSGSTVMVDDGSHGVRGLGDGGLSLCVQANAGASSRPTAEFRPAAPDTMLATHPSPPLDEIEHGSHQR